MVRIDASLLQTVPGGATASYYLGVAHYWEPAGGDSSSSGRVYKHYLIKVEAQPPFKVLKVRLRAPRRELWWWAGVGIWGRIAVCGLWQLCLA